MTKTLALDGDILAYRAACVNEDLDELYKDLEDRLIRISTNTGVPSMRIYLTGDDNFRYDVAVTKPYKGNRKQERPKLLTEARNYLRVMHNAITCHGYEADDGIASDMTQYGSIHCGQDKDIYQIAGTHYNFVTELWETVTPEQATLNLYRQILTGDSTDNIQGLPNVGEKTAEKIIHDADTAAQDARDYYKEVCANKLPDVDVRKYWKEQVQLVQLVTTLNIVDLVTTSVKGLLLKI